MSAAYLPLLAAIHTALDAALSCGLYNRGAVPQGASFPYVTIGGPMGDDWSTLSGEGEDIDVMVDVWSRYRGEKEAAQLMATVKGALHAKKLSVTGWHLAQLRLDFNTVFADRDGLTTHGVMRFRALLSR